MGTRAMIFYNDGKKSRGFYVSLDGYPDFTGKALKSKFNTYDKAKNLVENFSTKATKHFYGVAIDYGIAEVKGEELPLIDYVEYKHSLVEYIYLFSKYENEWLVYNTFSNKDFFSDFEASKRKMSSDNKVLFEMIFTQNSDLLFKMLNDEFNNKSIAQVVLDDARDFINYTIQDANKPFECEYATKFLSVSQSNASNFFAVEYKGQIKIYLEDCISEYLKFAKAFSEYQIDIGYDYFEGIVGLNTFSSNMLNAIQKFIDLLIKDKVLNEDVESEFFNYLINILYSSIYIKIPNNVNYIRGLDKDGFSTLDFSVIISLDIADY